MNDINTQPPGGNTEVPPQVSTPAAGPTPGTPPHTVQRIRTEIQRAVVGQDEVIEQVLTGLLAGGHVLIEGLPGLGKTLLVRALAKTFNGQSARIQFTPDLMPSDIIGHVMYDMKTTEFKTHRGPVFTNLLLADEINRAPAKTQAAMLEVMQEHQVTLEGTPHKLPQPFMTMATQNPFEHEGTYPLPDAQLDRFLLKVHIGYPDEAAEVRMVNQVTSDLVTDRLSTDNVQTVVDADAIVGLREACTKTRVDGRVTEYAVKIIRTTRQWPGLVQGAGPRGGLALIRAARAQALIAGRDYVTPDDVKNICLPALRHRVTLSPDTELEGQTPDQILTALLATVEAPRL